MKQKEPLLKYLSFLITEKEKNGKIPLNARITVNKEQAHFSTKLDISEGLWDTNSMMAKGRSEEARQINLVLDSIKAKIHSDYHHLINRDGYVTAVKLKNYFLGLDQQYETLLMSFDKHLENLQKKVQINTLSKSTFKKYVLTRKRIEEFMIEKYNYNDIPLISIRPTFIEDFALWLQTKYKLTINVYIKDIQLLKKIVTSAHDSGIIMQNPFAFYVLPVWLIAISQI